MSGGTGATNACTRMCRLAFIAEHGMRSYKAVLGLPVPGTRVNRPRYGNYFSDEGLVPAAALLVTFLAAEKSNSRTYSLVPTK